MKEIQEASVDAMVELFTDIHTNDAIPYDLAKKVIDHMLIATGKQYGYEGTLKVESAFMKRAAKALKEKRFMHGK